MSQLAANPPPRSETVAVWRGDSLVIGTWLDLDEDLVSVELTFVNKSGNPVPSNDIWIAAAAVRSGAVVLTYDAHFSAIERVGVLILQA